MKSMKQFLTEAKFDKSKTTKNVKDSIEAMKSEIIGIAMAIDDAEDASPYKVNRLFIDGCISRIDKELENLDNHCSRFFKDLKVDLNEATKKFGLTKVRVVTYDKGAEEFETFEDAKKKYPDLDMNRNTKRFTWGMNDGDAIRFEDWKVNDLMSH